jgi:ABC-type sugar transport system ATPase subunit
VTAAALVQIRDLSKSYGGVRALDQVSLEIARGEIHALCGENGAGKSTLIKILTGVVSADNGQVDVEQQPLAPASVAASEAAGIAVMHQESTAFPDLNAVDNLFVGRELTRCRGWLLDRRTMSRRAKELLERIREPLNLHTAVGDLPLAQRQMVALARALLLNCRLIIMDEPTASLSARETQTLMRLIRQLKADGVSILYVSHRLDEVFALADRVTVLRDGCHVATTSIDQLNREQLIKQMVGRQLGELTGRHGRSQAFQPTVLRVERLSSRNGLAEISLTVGRGEVVGLAGLIGSGRSELMRAIFGIDRYEHGRARRDLGERAPFAAQFRSSGNPGGCRPGTGGSPARRVDSADVGRPEFDARGAQVCLHAPGPGAEAPRGRFGAPAARTSAHQDSRSGRPRGNAFRRQSTKSRIGKMAREPTRSAAA